MELTIEQLAIYLPYDLIAYNLQRTFMGRPVYRKMIANNLMTFVLNTNKLKLAFRPLVELFGENANQDIRDELSDYELGIIDDELFIGGCAVGGAGTILGAISYNAVKVLVKNHYWIYDQEAFKTGTIIDINTLK